MRRLLTTVEAAKRLCVSRYRIWQFIKAKRLKATRVGALWLIDERDLERFARKPRRPGRRKR